MHGDDTVCLKNRSFSLEGAQPRTGGGIDDPDPGRTQRYRARLLLQHQKLVAGYPTIIIIEKYSIFWYLKLPKPLILVDFSRF